MISAETAGLVALVASMCPSMHLEETTAKNWYALLADLDAVDAHAAVIRLGRRQRHIAAADIRAEVRAIREERLARDPLPLPDADPDDPHRYRAELLAIVTAIASGQRVKRTPTVPPPPRPRRPLEERPPRPRPPRALPVVQSHPRPSVHRPPARHSTEERSGPRVETHRGRACRNEEKGGRAVSPKTSRSG